MRPSVGTMLAGLLTERQASSEVTAERCANRTGDVRGSGHRPTRRKRRAPGSAWPWGVGRGTDSRPFSYPEWPECAAPLSAGTEAPAQARCQGAPPRLSQSPCAGAGRPCRIDRNGPPACVRGGGGLACAGIHPVGQSDWSAALPRPRVRSWRNRFEAIPHGRQQLSESRDAKR